MPSLRRVNAAEMRRMFNEGQFWERVQAGELADLTEKSRHPSPPLTFEPFCTVSQVVHYYSRSPLKKVAIVHQYLRPDGTIGASGLPDPKALVIDDFQYVLDPDQH